MDALRGIATVFAAGAVLLAVAALGACAGSRVGGAGDVADVAAGTELADEAQRPGEHGEHGEHDGHGRLHEVPSGESPPTLAVSATEDPTGGWAVRLDVSGFGFAPRSVNGVHVHGEGHVHWYLDGVKQGRVYGEWLRVGELEPGEHTLMFELSGNDHGVYAVDGVPVTASVTVVDTPAGENLEHGHAHTVRAREPVPSVTLEAVGDGDGGWLVHAVPSGFRLTPGSVGGVHVPGEGHMALYAGDERLMRMYSEWVQLPDLGAGLHRLRVVLRSNDLRVLQSGGGQWIAAEASVVVAETADETGDGGLSDETDSHDHSHSHSDDDGDAAQRGAVFADAADGVPAVSDTHKIVYYRDGVFSPDRVVIPVGGTVTFVNEDRLLVWPASNIHPTHEILPEFDPLEPIPSGHYWSHTFTEAGYWRYHNHSAAEEIGLVVVESDGSEASVLLPAVFDLPDWPDPPEGDAVSFGLKTEDTLVEFVDVYGPVHAVALMSVHEYETNWYCHDMAHVVGRRSYENWGPGVILLAVHECRNGLSHGAMEALFAERGTSRLRDDILALCEPLDDRFERFNCMHGIGHGLMAWTSYEIHEALDLCSLAPDAWLAESCASGVFMENVVGGLSGAIGHTSAYVSETDPLLPCSVVDDRWLDACWTFHTSHVLALNGRDFAATATICLEQPTVVHTACFNSLGRDAATGDIDLSPDIIVARCMHAPGGDLQVSCLTGAAQNLFWDAAGAYRAVRICNTGFYEGINPVPCYDHLTGRAASLLDDTARREQFCDWIATHEETGRCRTELLAEHSHPLDDDTDSDPRGHADIRN